MPSYQLFKQDDAGAAESITEIRAAFAPDRKKIFVIGAGASQSAGISTFENRNGTVRKYGGRAIMSETVFRTADQTAKYLRLVEMMLEEVARATPTPFHWMLDGLAKRGDDIRIYTQNIDGLEFRCPRLSPRNVVPLHGLIGKMACNICHEVFDMDITLFAGGQLALCSSCPDKKEDIHHKRTRMSLPRSASQKIGILKPFVRLYDGSDDEWPGLDFTHSLMHDLYEHPADTVVVAGTNMTVPGAQKLVEDLSTVMHNESSNALAVWLNPKDLPQKLVRADIFDYALRGTCDQFASFIVSDGA